MEFIKPNYINTTTGFTVQSNTVTAGYLFDRDTSFQYVSSGYNNDLTTTSIRVNFSETLTVDRIALVEHNLKAFTIFYNGATANTFALTTTGSTIASDFATNSETSHYLRCTPVACTSVTFDLKKTITADQEKAIGYLVISQKRLDFVADGRIPNAKNYKPMINPKQIVHTLSDGGTRVQSVQDRWSFEIKLDYVTSAFRDSLKAIWGLHDESIFVPFGTTTGWDAVIAPVVWVGAFDFYKYAADAPGAGFSGSIKLRETPE